MSDTEKKRAPAPAVTPPVSEVVAPGQQALERIKRPTFNVRPDEAIFHDPSVETLRANQYRSGGWLHSPAHLELFANTDRRLTKVANQLGDPCEFVERVQALRVKGTRIVYIWPADKEDPDAIEVKRYNSSAWINLITLLGPATMTMEPGFKQRYEVNFSQPEDHVYPALKIDLTRVLDRKKEGDARPDEGEAGDPESPAETGTTSEEQT